MRRAGGASRPQSPSRVGGLPGEPAELGATPGGGGGGGGTESRFVTTQFTTTRIATAKTEGRRPCERRGSCRAWLWSRRRKVGAGLLVVVGVCVWWCWFAAVVVVEVESPTQGERGGAVRGKREEDGTQGFARETSWPCAGCERVFGPNQQLLVVDAHVAGPKSFTGTVILRSCKFVPRFRWEGPVRTSVGDSTGTLLLTQRKGSFSCSQMPRYQPFCGHALQVLQLELWLEKDLLFEAHGTISMPVPGVFVDQIEPEGFVEPCLGESVDELDGARRAAEHGRKNFAGNELRFSFARRPREDLKKAATRVCTRVHGEVSDWQLNNWLEHYVARHGIDNIRLYDVREDPSAPPLWPQVVDKRIAQRLEVVDIRSIRSMLETEENQHLQMVAMHDCTLESRGVFKWVMFFDVDEFVSFPPPQRTGETETTLASFVRESIHAECRSISFGPVHFAKEMCNSVWPKDRPHSLSFLRQAALFHLDDDQDHLAKRLADPNRPRTIARAVGVHHGIRGRRKVALNMDTIGAELRNVHQPMSSKFSCHMPLHKARIDHYRGYGSNLSPVCQFAPSGDWSGAFDCSETAEENQSHDFCSSFLRSHKGQVILSSRLANNFPVELS